MVRDDEDFEVTELPAYLPSGEGEHVFLWIKKRGLTTAQAVERLAQHGDADSRESGTAGLKDKRGVTYQWISFSGVDPDRFVGFDTPELQVLEVRRHGNKLRTGHLRGNRFVITLHGVQAGAEAIAAERMSQLSRGMPNYFGEQRFGIHGDNAERALAALRGQGSLPRDKRKRRLLISALQSQIFNRFVSARLEGAGLFQVLDGDVLQKGDSGPTFVSEDAVLDQTRLDSGELRLTGPICGPRTPLARAGSAAAEWESALLAELGIDYAAFGVFGRSARGGRRPLSVSVGAAEVVPRGPETLQLRFELPAGSYATELLKELGSEGRRPTQARS